MPKTLLRYTFIHYVYIKALNMHMNPYEGYFKTHKSVMEEEVEVND